jgi:small-conductance mechanosensitive channel
MLLIGAFLSTYHGNIHAGSIKHKVVSLIGVFIFVIFSSLFLHILSNAVQGSITLNRLGAGRAGAIQFILRIIGYTTIFLITLELVGISIEKLLIGGAFLGIILGVAAQQALSNFFASIVLILAHPFAVGEHIVIRSGGLGGEYEGKVKDIGLTHTKIKDLNGDIVNLPNAALLAGASVRAVKNKPAPIPDKE